MVLNPAPACPLPPGLLALVDFLVPNEIEASALAGRPVASVADAIAAGRRLRADGAGTVLVTVGAEGVVTVGLDGEQAVEKLSRRQICLEQHRSVVIKQRQRFPNHVQALQQSEARIRALLDAPEVARVTYLRLEIVGPRLVSVVGDVDLTGDEAESHVAVRLRALEARISTSPAVAGAVLSLSAPDEPTLEV